MDDSLNIQKFVEELEANSHRVRLKKLMLCACRNYWENDRNKLEAIDSIDLAKELYEFAPTLEHLNSILIRVVKKINKQEFYFWLANQLVKSFRNIYPVRNYDLNKIHHDLKKNTKTLKNKQLFDLNFLVDLKFTVSRYTSLSRAKILIYSALNYKFKYTIQDWNLLNQKEFDDLVRALLSNCETIEDLEFRLQGSAKYLEEPNKNTEISKIIIESTKRFYSYLKQNNIKEKRDSTIEVEIKKTELNVIDDDQLTEMPKIVESDFLLKESENNKSDLEIDRIKANTEIEEEMQKISKTKVNLVMEEIDHVLKELESQLSNHFEETDSEHYLNLKYRLLSHFIQDLQTTSSKYLNVLKTLEQSEKQNLHS